ncbi:uncharacterized protein LOC118440536 [Vespa mandarinia]|uniref:uncharacterized protein LOC118440536 n=1 Tax=Vespa mandarinia TaxID=7446 RepID=UPI00161BE0B6|nr:uncharacterized protein LOC118440536 [Vespa mandarinia]
MKTQFEILISIITLHLTIADIVVQPEYTRPYVQYQPVQKEFLLAPHQYRTSEFSYGQSRFIPIYLNRPQVNNPLVGSIQNDNILLRYAHPKTLHAAKIGGHTIVHPSYLIGQYSTTPSVVHRRFKKSIENQITRDSRKTGESGAVQSDSSLNRQTMSNFVESQNPNIKEIKDKTNQAKQSDQESTNSGTLFNLNPEKIIPEDQISLNVQENHNPANAQESINNSNLPSIEDIVTDYVPPKSENVMDNPNLRNFPDPRPIKIVPNTKSKSTQFNVQNEKMKYNEGGDPIIGSAQMKNSNSLIKDHFQQNYPTRSSISNYYQSPLYSNLFIPAVEYQPDVYMVSNNMDGCNQPLNVGQQFWTQQQIYQDGTNQATGTISNNEYQHQYNYLTNYALRYPNVPYYNALLAYPNTYVQFY